MAYIDVEGRRFDNLVPWRMWNPGPAPAIFGFFIVSNPSEDWESSNVTVRREVDLVTGEEITRLQQIDGALESWVLEWEHTAVYPGEVFAVGSYGLSSNDRDTMRREKCALYDTGRFTPPSDEQVIDQLTQDLRSGNPYWKRISTCLAGQGLDPQAVLIADIWSEDVAVEHGRAVTPAGQVFEFEFTWHDSTRNDGYFAEWRDVTSSWGNLYGPERVAVALRLANVQETVDART